MPAHENPPDLLEGILDRFAEACTTNLRLTQMNRDWHRTILVVADEGERYWLRCEGGPVHRLEQEAEAVDLSVEGPRQILCDIFSGASPPTEPYMTGDLRVRGSQDDIMRLDIISLLIWGE